MKTKFPNLLLAVKHRQQHLDSTEGKDLWTVGEAMVKDFKGLERKTSRSDVLFKDAATELEKAGFEYSSSWLARIHETVLAFPPSKRHVNLSFRVHMEAGNSEILEWIVKQSPKGQSIALHYVSAMVSQWMKRHEAKTKHQHQAATFKKKQAEQKLKRASDDKERERAEADIEAADAEIERTEQPPSRRDLPPPDKHEGASVLRELTLRRLSREAIKLANEAKVGINDVVAELDENTIEVLAEAAMKAANAWSTVATTVRKAAAAKKGGHLTVVGE